MAMNAMIVYIHLVGMSYKCKFHLQTGLLDIIYNFACTNSIKFYIWHIFNNSFWILDLHETFLNRSHVSLINIFLGDD